VKTFDLVSNDVGGSNSFGDSVAGTFENNSSERFFFS